MKTISLEQFESSVERIAENINQRATKTDLDGKLDTTGKAETAGTADNAIRDGEGNVISSTYLKKSDNVSVDLSNYITKLEASNTYLAKTALNIINAVPVQSGTITYDGTAKTPTWLNYDPLKLQISGDYQNKTNAGTYQTGFKPISPCTWQNGSQNIQNTSWTIGKAAGSLSLSAESGSVNIDATSTFTVDRAGDGAITVNSSNANTASVSVSGNTVTVTGKAAGSATITVKVAEGTNHFAPADKTYAVTVTKIPLNLSASISDAVTYNTTGTINLNGNSGGGAVTATSDNSSCVTVSSTTASTVTVKCANYSAAATQITINVAETTKYTSGTCTCNVTTAKAEPTLTLSTNAVVLTSVNPTATVTVTTNTTGALSATSADTNTVIVSLSEKTITIEASGHGFADVTVAVQETSNFTAISKTFSVDTSVAAVNMINSRRNISEVASLFGNGQAAKYFKPGDYFDVTFPYSISLDNGNSIPANSTWRAVCIGIYHNSGLESFTAGHFCLCETTDGIDISFLGKAMNSSNTNAGGWKESNMRNWLNTTFFNALPSDLRNVISACNKYTDNTGGPSALESNVTITSDKIWLLSEFEVFGSQRFANPYEQNKQVQYEYFKNGNGKTLVYHNDMDTTGATWLRSPYYSSGYHSSFFCAKAYQGVPADAWAASSKEAFNPCFVIGGY